MIFLVRFKKSILCAILFLPPVFTQVELNAQIGLGGFNGVMTVPSARVLDEGDYAIGMGYIPKEHAVWQNRTLDNLPYFATLGFLPFMEISLRATKALKRPTGSIGDRMASVRFLVFSEKSTFPAILIGIHDMSALLRKREWFHAFYLVSTKKIELVSGVHLESSLGFGVDWFDALHHEFNGIFGGLSFGLGNGLFLKTEYDTEIYNIGLGLELFNILSANFLLMDLKDFAFGINLHHRL